jgi:hypothetical protein
VSTFGELHEHGQQTLPHLRVPVEDGHREVGLDHQSGLAPFLRAVADAAVLQAAREADRATLCAGAVVMRLHGRQRLLDADRFLEHLPG